MIDKLENVSYVESVLGKNGINSTRITRLPNNEEIVQKINEIIDYINAEEIGDENDRARIIREDK